MQVNDVKELKGLRDENAHLKKLLAERDLELDVMKEINKKVLGPGLRSTMALFATL